MPTHMRFAAVVLCALCVSVLATGCTFRPPAAPRALPSANPALAAPPELARRTGIPEATVRLVGKQGANLRQLVGEDEGGDPRPAPGLVVDVSGGDWHQTVKELRGEVGAGYIVFCTEQGFSLKPDQVAVLRAKDQFEALRAMSTSGPNWDITPAQVQERARKWDQAYGLVVVGAGIDWMEAEFRRPPADMNAFAREVYKFCPDVVDQGTGTVDKLADEMRRTSRVFLWWD